MASETFSQAQALEEDRPYEAAAELYRQAAEGGEAEAHLKLGRPFLTGRGVPEDETLGRLLVA